MLTRDDLDVIYEALGIAVEENTGLRDDPHLKFQAVQDKVRELQQAPRFKHIRRTEHIYDVVLRGTLQNATEHVFKEGDRLVGYRADGGLEGYFRFEPEFEDGRFVKL